MVKEGLINLDFADVRSIMSEMGKAMMGTGEATGEKRAVQAAEAAIANPLLDETSMRGARGLLISITGGNDLTLYEVDEAASRIRQEVDEEANIILGATFDSALDGVVRVSVVATGIDQAAIDQIEPVTTYLLAGRGACAGARALLGRSVARSRTPSEAAAPMAYRDAAAPSRTRSSRRHRNSGGGARGGVHPPAAEQPMARAARMPQIDDLPQVAQNQLRALREAQGASRRRKPAGVRCSRNSPPSASPATRTSRPRRLPRRSRRNPCRRRPSRRCSALTLRRLKRTSAVLKRASGAALSRRRARPAWTGGPAASGDGGRSLGDSGVSAPSSQLICVGREAVARRRRSRLCFARHVAKQLQIID